MIPFKQVTLPSAVLNYVAPEHNQGQRVLLIHGLGSTAEMWQLQMPVLAENGFLPVAMDIPGFGDSRFLKKGWSIGRAAATLVEYLDGTGSEQADVVGISMGGTVALTLALDYPERVRRLVLVNTFARLRPNTAGGWLYFVKRAVMISTMGLEAQARFVSHRIFPNPEQAELRAELFKQVMQADPAAYRGTMKALGLFDVHRRLKDIRARTLVVTGANDTTVAPANQAELALQIPGAKQVIIPQAGHAVVIDQVEAFNQTLLDFLKA